ncbi:MAG: D-glycerate dehydrogenase [Gemmatimonadota bacterium]|nr:D-glycerate dehydrogenase [Gemmatimonadota bacterium]
MIHVLIAAELKELLEQPPLPGFEIEWIPNTAPTPRGPYVGAVPLLSRPFGERELEGLPKLRVIANCAVGFDNIDLAAAARHQVVVTNTPDVLTESTADLTWALLLAVARRLKEGSALVAEGRWSGWHPQQLLGLELEGATLGIVGAGRIGQAVGLRAVGFGMRVLYTDSRRRDAFELETGAIRESLETLLAESDVVTVHLPSNAQTRGMVNGSWFAMMRPGALLVNTARGDLIDEPALLEALTAGRLGGAGLDVFPREPIVHEALIAHPRVVTLPHIGSATTVTRRAMAELAVQNVLEVLRGREPLTPVPLPTTGGEAAPR